MDLESYITIFNNKIQHFIIHSILCSFSMVTKTSKKIDFIYVIIKTLIYFLNQLMWIQDIQSWTSLTFVFFFSSINMLIQIEQHTYFLFPFCL
jgi:hypothetical protein